MNQLITISLGVLTMVPGLLAADSFRLWPEQKAPAGIISLSTADCRAPLPAGGGHHDENLILAQSLAGLTALAVNEGRLDELVYILEEGNSHYALWRARLLARTGIQDRGQTNLWALIDRYKGKGVCDGYILYHSDCSDGDTHTCRPGSDESVNVATTAAGLLRGLVVSEALEPAAQAAGLKCLLDVRGKSEQWAFENFRDRLNRRGVLLQDPRLWFGRGTAIANRFFCMYGLDAPAEPVYDWMDKPGLVFGWNDGRREQESVLQLCERGHVISASDWELNLSALSIGSSALQSKRFHGAAAPEGSPVNEPAVSFCMSDGDNLQWMLRDFANNKNYWAAPEHGTFPMGWSLPLADLLETGVDIYQYLQQTQPEKSGVFMMTEYFFPDIYARRLPSEQRRALLQQLGGRAERAIVASGVDILGFLVNDLDSPATRESLEIMASAMPSLGALLVWPFHPYQGGNGSVMWIRGAKGQLPVIACKYSLWSERRDRRAGPPAKLAREINEDARAGGKDYQAWAIVHAWSGFKENAGPDEAAENGKYLAPGTKAGVAPTEWCIKRLDPAIQVVTPAELVRRIKAQPMDWWPAQKAAKAYVDVAAPQSFVERNLLQGLVGLAARAVNEGRGDELVWVDDGNAAIKEWKRRAVERFSMEKRGGLSVWELVERYRDKGLVKGYVVYRAEVDHRETALTNESLNVATTLAGLLDAVPVEESLEDQLKGYGLARLADGRALSLVEAFERYRGQCDSNAVYLLNPRLPNMRDMAVAHRGFAGYGTNGTTRALLDWAIPLAPVIGWGQGDEYKHVAPVSRAGHFHTVSDCSQNIPFLSAGARDYRVRRLPAFDPRTIDLSDKRPCVAFMMSDGDNLGYMMAVIWAKSFWNHPAHGQFPMGFSACLADLAQTMPMVVDHIVETKPPRTSVIQFTGGYFYPDLFAADRTNRWGLLREHARRINAQMQRTGATVMCCIMDKSDSPEAQQALRIFAEEINPLLGIMIMEYAPYHGGGGKVHWVPDGRGGEVPAVSARYCMWAGMGGKGAGGPDEISKQVNSDAVMEPAAGGSWVAVHAWSQHPVPGTDRKESGLGPVARCVEMLDRSKVQVVSPEEMLWRLRRGRDESIHR